MMIWRMATLGFGLFTLIFAATASAQYPEKPVRVLTQGAAGGAPDVIARLITPKLSTIWDKSVVVENIPGVGGILNADRIAKSAPDGYTLGIVGDAPMTTNVTLYAGKLPYNPLRDFTLVTIITQQANLLVIHPSISAKNVKELIAHAKSQSGKLSYSSAGNGTSQHLSGELLKSMAGLDILHIPYKNNLQPLQDVAGGQVAMTFANVISAAGLARDGRVRALAVTSAKRVAIVPEIPTMSEAGLPGFDVTSWFALVAPAGIPASIAAKLQKDVLNVLGQADVRTRIDGMGASIVGNTPEEFHAQVKAEIAAKGKIVKDAGVTPD
jgi:tripartite-type tricarboxylate transporter receptor subunit TctC